MDGKYKGFTIVAKDKMCSTYGGMNWADHVI